MRQPQQIIRKVVRVAALLAPLLVVEQTQAFERQWRVGGGAGFATLRKSDLGPALDVHAAYGLDDMFDVNVELLASRHGGAEGTDVFSASVGAAYKIDILQWVPYVGVFAGYYYFAGLPGPNGQQGNDFGASIGGGLDYLWTRAFAVGIQARGHVSFIDGVSLSPSFPMFSLTARAEYRWGY